MNKNTLAVLIAIVVLAGGAWVLLSSRQPATQTPGEAMTGQKYVMQLATQNNSGESGTATLTEANGQTTVVVEMTGFTANVSQPAHIHLGSCPKVGAVKYPLTNVLNGKSTTVLNATLSQIQSELPLGINIHKSAAEASVYTACGDLTF